MTAIKPMLAEIGKTKDLDRKDWIYEQKLDGARCIAILDSQTKLQARRGSDITHKFPN
jgi:ATP-dependent DNA ligase